MHFGKRGWSFALRPRSADADIEAIDEDFDDVTDAREVTTQGQLKTNWAALEATVGADDRLKVVAKDLLPNGGQSGVVDCSRARDRTLT